MNNKIEIPEGLGDLLRDFTVHVLRDRPSDIYTFAAQYFVRVADARHAQQPPMYVIVDGEQDGEAADQVGTFSTGNPGTKPIKTRFPRRKSVAAERYDPEQDSEDGFVCRVHPKTEVQRTRLLEAVRGILLFRALDADQMTAVINAMFERHVTPGENVIVQGDDGDNFYAIESGTYHVFQKTDDGQQRKVSVITT
jgi:cAMP-dependent protein kinase regulator